MNHWQHLQWCNKCHIWGNLLGFLLALVVLHLQASPAMSNVTHKQNSKTITRNPAVVGMTASCTSTFSSKFISWMLIKSLHCITGQNGSWLVHSFTSKSNIEMFYSINWLDSLVLGPKLRKIQWTILLMFCFTLFQQESLPLANIPYNRSVSVSSR